MSLCASVSDGEAGDSVERINIHFEWLQHSLDAGAVQLNAILKALGSRLDENVPLDIADRIIGGGAIPPIVLK